MDELTPELDIVHRDSKEVNSHLEVKFDDVLGEPTGATSVECLWRTTYRLYRCSKGCCYNLCAILSAIFISIFWGCEYALISYSHIWCFSPFLRMYAMNCSQFQKCYGTIMNCVVLPLCETVGLLFSNISFAESGKPGHQTRIPQIRVPK